VRALGRFSSTRALELVEGEAAHGLQEAEAGLAVLGVDHGDKGGIDQVEQHVSQIRASQVHGGHHRLDRLERRSAHEHPKTVQYRPVRGVEQVIAPPDRTADRGLPRVPRPVRRGEVEALVDPRQMAFGDNSLHRAAASSTASGSPSRAVHTAAMSPRLSGVSANPRRTRLACWVNSSTAASTGNGVTANSCSPATCNARRDVATTATCRACASSSRTTTSASAICSRLSSTNKTRRWATYVKNPGGIWPSAGTSSTPDRLAHIPAALLTPAIGATNTPSGNASATEAANA